MSTRLKTPGPGRSPRPTLGRNIRRPTCEVKNLCPLFADVDLDICAPKGQVGTALVKDQRLHLPEPERKSHEGNRNDGAIREKEKQFRLIW